MPNLLRSQDAGTVEMACGSGSVLIPPSLQGRVFCQLDGELIHRLDRDGYQNPSPVEYNNLGGNSLWPAPEGGPCAFNYLDGSEAWVVQDGIGKTVPSVALVEKRCAVVEKRITLANRGGVDVRLQYRRLVHATEPSPVPPGYALQGMVYRTEDLFEPLEDYSTDRVLLAPWSLEQFPGGDGILAFGKVSGEGDALNFDFYGDPRDRITRGPGFFVYRLGGDARQQIGVTVASRPELIGALDTHRSLLLLRKTQPEGGRYFNIADNDQPAGPYSAADLYSIFNGGDLGFYELETVGAMRSFAGTLATSVLSSSTLILQGRMEELLRYLVEHEGLRLEEFVHSMSA